MNLLGIAFAQAAPIAVTAPKFDFMSMIPFVFLIVVGYFLMFRPQQKKMKQQKDMITALRRGDRVMTSSGIIGSIHKVINDEEILVEIAENVRVRMVKTSIGQVLAKTAPVDMNNQFDYNYDSENTVHDSVTHSELSHTMGNKKVIKTPVRTKKNSHKTE